MQNILFFFYISVTGVLAAKCEITRLKGKKTFSLIRHLMGLKCYSLLVEWSISVVLVATFFGIYLSEAYSHKFFVCICAQSVGIFLCQTKVCLGKTDSRPAFLAPLVHLETCQSTFLLIRSCILVRKLQGKEQRGNLLKAFLVGRGKRAPSCLQYLAGLFI